MMTARTLRRRKKRANETFRSAQAEAEAEKCSDATRRLLMPEHLRGLSWERTS